MPTNMNIARMPRWCILFVDLDGTIRYSQRGTPWCNFPEDVRIYPEARERLTWFRLAGWHVVGVSNQAGPVLGECEFEPIMAGIRKTVNDCGSKIAGAPAEVSGMRIFSDCVVCFHHPDDGCMCRKPAVGMIHMGVQNFLRTEAKGKGIVQPGNCLVVGDRPEDEGMAKNAGIAFMKAEEWRSLSREELAPWLDLYRQRNQREDYVAAGLLTDEPKQVN